MVYQKLILRLEVELSFSKYLPLDYSLALSSLGYLINILQPSYTLDDNLVIEYDDNVIYDNSKNDIDIYRLTFNNGNLDYIEKIIY